MISPETNCLSGSSDAGYARLGKPVNMKHIVLLRNRDDSLDTDLGYRGNIQYLNAENSRVEAGQYCRGSGYTLINGAYAKRNDWRKGWSYGLD